MNTPRIELAGERLPGADALLTEAALEFLTALHQRFNPTRRELLAQRRLRVRALQSGDTPTFTPASRELRRSEWAVGPIPEDLQKRHVEITGPTDAKMVINALNSGADVFMADFEDANSPTWRNMVTGQLNLQSAVRRTLALDTPEGKSYRLNDSVATLMVRPRGWHLEESHVLIDGEPCSASLFDFGLYLVHNAHELLASGSGPYFYLPKLENHREARLWNDVFTFAEQALELPRGSIKATVLIETVLAACEMDEILFELREHIVGLNAGRWDYIFSVIKKLGHAPHPVLPDRAQITMTVPFMRAYTELLVKTCHRRGAHAIGGMAAFIPSRRDAQVNNVALAKVREDKQREVNDGCDGTWVAHPDLVPTAREVFAAALGDQPHQKHRTRDDVNITPAQLLDFQIPGGRITEAGLRTNITIAIQYIESWLRGSGAVAINNLMEDAATAEISRAQVWQWLHRKATLDDGRTVTPQLYREIFDDEVAKLQQALGAEAFEAGRYDAATQIVDRLITDAEFPEFLTLVAQEHLEHAEAAAA